MTANTSRRADQRGKLAYPGSPKARAQPVMKTVFSISLLGLSLAGCSTPGVRLPEGTRFLGEVMGVLTTQMVDQGTLGGGTHINELREQIGHNYSEEQIRSGRVIVLREGIYWNNNASGIKRNMLNTAFLPPGMSVEIGNIIEGLQHESRPYYVVDQVRANNLADGNCFFEELPTGAIKGLLGAVSLVGPGGAATLYCAGIENEGWQRPRTYWHKLPDAGGLNTPSGVIQPHKPVSALPDVNANKAPEPEFVTDKSLARLIVRRPDKFEGIPIDLPVWVDGEKIAELTRGQCTVVLLAPGPHQLSAGNGTVLGIGLPKLKLSLEAAAGSNFVANYFWEDHDWVNRSFKFTIHPETQDEACPLTHPPRVIRPAP